MADRPHIYAAWWLQRINGPASLRRRSRVVVVQRDKTSPAIRDDELEQSLFSRTADVRMVAQRLHGLVDHIEHAASEPYILFGVEIEDPLEAALSAQRIDYPGHFLGRGRRTFFPSAR